METNTVEQPTENKTLVVSAEAMLNHWQGHRRLSRKVLEAFPEDQLYTYSIGGMRSYAELTMEMLDLAGAGVQGIVTGDWSGYGLSSDGSHTSAPASKADLLTLWDSITEKINVFWPQIEADRFQEVDVAFGQYENHNYATLLYFIDNEIHHRGQGYVYLRALGVEPPAFWDRS